MKSLKFRIAATFAAVALAGVTFVSATAGQATQAQSPTEEDAPIVYAGGYGLYPSN